MYTHICLHLIEVSKKNKGNSITVHVYSKKEGFNVLRRKLVKNEVEM